MGILSARKSFQNEIASKDFFSKCDQIHRKLRIWSHLLKKSLSRTEVFCKKSVLKSLAKFTGKHLCQGLLFNEVAGEAFNFYLKKRFSCFPVNFAKLLRIPFFLKNTGGCYCSSQGTLTFACNELT